MFQMFWVNDNVGGQEKDSGQSAVAAGAHVYLFAGLSWDVGEGNTKLGRSQCRMMPRTLLTVHIG